MSLLDILSSIFNVGDLFILFLTFGGGAVMSYLKRKHGKEKAEKIRDNMMVTVLSIAFGIVGVGLTVTSILEGIYILAVAGGILIILAILSNRKWIEKQLQGVSM